MRETQTPEGIDFGTPELEKVRLVDINVLPQTRREIITPESVLELKNSITRPGPNGQPLNELLHAPVVNFLEQREAKQYVSDVNDCQGTNFRFDAMVPAVNGIYLAMVGGHRRNFAMRLAVQEQRKSLELSNVWVNPRFNMPYGEALLIQIGENSHSPISPVDEARSIKGAFLWGLETGRYQTASDFIREVSYSEEKVRNALNYCQLPEDIRNMVEGYSNSRGEWIAPTLSYSSAVALYPLQKALQKRHASQSPELVEELVKTRLLGEATQAIARKWSPRDINERIQNTVKGWRTVSAEALFDVEDDWIQAKELYKRAHAELMRDVVPRADHLLRGLGSGALLLEGMKYDEKALMLEKLDALRDHLSRSIEQTPQSNTLSNLQLDEAFEGISA